MLCIQQLTHIVKVKVYSKVCLFSRTLSFEKLTRYKPVCRTCGTKHFYSMDCTVCRGWTRARSAWCRWHSRQSPQNPQIHLQVVPVLVDGPHNKSCQQEHREIRSTICKWVLFFLEIIYQSIIWCTLFKR